MTSPDHPLATLPPQGRPDPFGRPRWQTDLAWAVAGALLLLLWDYSGLDRAVMHLVGTPQGFAWRHHWLTSTVLHQGGRALAWVVFVGLLVDLWRHWLPGPSRQEKRDGLLALLACLIVVPGMKRFSNTSCPWDLDEFGGTAHYVSHWAFGLTDGGDGHCFPSGHATAAFAFLALYFLWRKHRPVLARRVLIGVLAVGALFGWAQLMRGAHYPSHTLWSAWWCWTICALTAAWSGTRSRPATAPAHQTGR